MKRITGLVALFAAMLLGTASAWAVVPEAGHDDAPPATAAGKAATPGTGQVPVTDGGRGGSATQAVRDNTSRGTTDPGLIGPGAGYASPHGSARVRSVQHLLRRAGEHPGPVDGRFGPLTGEAVERFQASEGLAVDGIVGPLTAAALKRQAELIALGDGYGSAHGSTRVRSVQRLLLRAGERPGPVDGRFGLLTRAAVERFQAREGLAVDGIVGRVTLARLERPGAASATRLGPQAPRGEAGTANGDQEPGGAPKAPEGAGASRISRPAPMPVTSPLQSRVPHWLIASAFAAMLLSAAVLLVLAPRGRLGATGGRAGDLPAFQACFMGREGRSRVMTAAELLSLAASAEGHHALALPGRAPGAVGPRAVALCRIGPGSIRPEEPIGQPDGLIVSDPGLLRSDHGVRRLAPADYLLVNSTESLEELGLTELATGLRADRRLTIPATELALEHLGVPLPDTALVGGFVALSGLVSLTSVIGSICERFRGRRMEREVAVAKAAYGYVERELRRCSPSKEREPAWTLVAAPIRRVPELQSAGTGERPNQEGRRPA